nr:DUF4936 family protein [uncultured Noviherbaspirillum sp.]
MDLYIYYKVDACAAPDLAARIAVMQSELANRLGVVAVLRRRPGEQQGKQTWMEVYPDVPPGFDAALAQAVSDSGIEALVSGPRHTEIFVELQACA